MRAPSGATPHCASTVLTDAQIEATGGEDAFFLNEPIDDELSMEDDNSSAFNTRIIEGTSEISRHAYRLAVRADVPCMPTRKVHLYYISRN